MRLGSASSLIQEACSTQEWMSQSGCRHLCAGTCQHGERSRHLCRHLDVLARADTSTCRHVLTYECYLEAGMCWHVSASRRCRHLRRCRHVPTCADTCRCRHVPTPVISVIWTLLGYWDVLAYASTCKGFDTCWHVPTHQGAGTDLTHLRADTSMCRHVLTYECYLEAGMCWHMSAPQRCRHLRRCRHVPTPVGADTCDISHMDFIWILRCAGICQHLQRCRHVLACANTSRCRHRCQHIYVKTHLCADTCWHMNVIWKLECADMYQHLKGADTWEGAGTCRHL